MAVAQPLAPSGTVPARGATRDVRRLAALLKAHAAFGVIVLAMLALAVVCVRDAVGWIDKPFAGFLFYEFPVVGSFGEREWPGMQAGLRYRDVVLEVNGRPISSGREIQQAVRETRVGQRIQFLIDRKGDRIRVDLPVVEFWLGDFLTVFMLPFLAGMVFWSLGIIVYLLKPAGSTTWAFVLLCTFLGTYFTTGFQVQSQPELPWYLITAISMSFFPMAAYHLSLVFPERSTWVEKRPSYQVAPYAFGLGLCLYHYADVLALARPDLETPDVLRHTAHMLRTVHFTRLCGVVAAVAIVVASAHALWRSASILAKQRARIVLLGSGVAFVPASIMMGLAALTRLLVPFNLLAFPGLVFPSAIAYAIARHNLFDVDVYVKRAVGYGIMTGVVGAGYFGLQSVMSPAMLGSLFGKHVETAYPFVFAVLVVFLFNPVSRRVQAAIDRVFFRSQFDYKETISSVSTALTSLLNLDQIVAQVIGTVRTHMFVEAAGVIVLQPDRGPSRAFVFRDEAPGASSEVRDVTVPHDDPLLALVATEQRLLTKYDIEEDTRYRAVRERCLKSFVDLSATIVVPLLFRGQVTGALALGNKKSGRFHSREDIDLLGTMANQAAVAIANATAHERVVRYAEDLEVSLRRIQMLESIKSNLSKFVPKTVQELIEQSPEAPSLDKREADVSVVFADITGYTKLSAQMEDLDVVNRLVERYFGAFLDEIIRYGGDVNETAGDGLMVIFRDPDTKRHARAAVEAALGIHRRTLEINDELAGQSEPLTMHIGVNSGIASVGATKIEGLAGTRWTYTASGPTTNIAARLAALGEAGAVVISEETMRRIGEDFVAEDLGPQSLKNVPHPVRAYSVRGAVSLSASGEAIRRERRQYMRQPSSLAVTLRVGDAAFEGVALDCSRFGMRIGGVRGDDLAVGQQCSIDIHLGDDPVSFVGEIRHVSEDSVGIETKQPLPIA